MPEPSTADKVLQHLKGFNLKSEGSGQYRCNRPWSSGSDSMGLTVKIEDGEHGCFDDKPGGESGSLYQLAEKLGIDRPVHQVETSKRLYSNLTDYAKQHGVEPDVLTAAKWSEGEHQGRKCIVIPTATGTRYRFLDGEKPSYKSQYEYKACWYGLDRILTTKPDLLIICNGECSTLVAQRFGLPAIAKTGGEGKLPDDLLNELKTKWQGTLYIALDCDNTGREAAAAIQAQLPDAKIIDLQLSNHGDLADFCKLYTTDSLIELQRRAGTEPTAPVEADDDAISKSVKSLAAQRRQQFHDVQSGKIQQLGLQSKIPALDYAVGTFKAYRSHIVLGATGMGKSTLAAVIAAGFMQQAPGLIVSTETPKELWLDKIAAFVARVPVDIILDGVADKEQRRRINKAYDFIEQCSVRMMDITAPDIGDIEDWVKRWMEPMGAKWLIVDSISRVIARGKNNIFEKTTNVSNRLQSLTLDTGLCTVSTSQVGRQLRERANKIPTIQDGYGSGALEQDADVVLPLYYHHYYVDQGLVKPDPIYPPGKALTYVGKHRWRGLRDNRVWMQFNGGVGFFPWVDDKTNHHPPSQQVIPMGGSEPKPKEDIDFFAMEH